MDKAEGELPKGSGTMVWKSKWGVVTACLTILAGSFAVPAYAGNNHSELCAIRVKDIGLIGYVDTAGHWLVQPTIEDGFKFSDGLVWNVRKDSWFLIDGNGKETAIKNIVWGEPFIDGIARVKRNGTWGYIDKTGRDVTPALYDDGSASFSGGLAAVKRNGKYGYIDKTGREVLSPQYENAFSFSEGLAKVKSNGKYGYIDKTGREVIALQYEDVGSFSEGQTEVKRNGKWGYIDKTGQEIIAPQYEYAYPFSEGLAAVKRNGKYGYIDKTGHEVIALQYDEPDSFSDGLAQIKRNGKYGYIDKTGSEVIAPRYERTNSFSDGLAAVKRNGKYGYIDKTGREVLTVRYEYADRCSNGIYKVRDNDNSPIYLLDANLNRITEFDRQEEARAPDYYKFQRALSGSDPQKMYLAAGSYARSGDDAKAKQIFEAIIDRFPDSDFAVKANDQLLATKRAGETDKPRKQAASAPTQQQSSSRFHEGDRVCVNVWQGTGYCGVVDRVSGDSLKVEINSISCGGFIGLCNASECSGGKNVSRSLQGAAREGDVVWTKEYCVTSK